jgi:outer membrane protein, multidrug efflux system
MLRTLILSASALALAACASVGGYEPKVAPTPIPHGFQGAPLSPEAQPRTDWWAALNDPVLDRLVARVLTANRDLLAAEAEVKRARALAKLEGWSLVPSGGVSTAAGRQKDLGVESDFASVGAEVAWEADVFGRLRNLKSAAEADALGMDDARRGVMAAIAAQTALTYVDLRGAQARLAAGQDNAAAQGETRRLTEALRNAGRATPLDVLRANAQLETTRSNLSLLQAQIDGDIAAIDVLAAGLSPELKGQLVRPAAGPVPPNQFGLGSPDDLLRRRPDIRQAEARLQAASARLRATRVDWWPRLSFVGSASSTALDFQGLNAGSALSFLVGPRIDWPALDVRRNALRTEAARYGAEAEYLRYDKAVLAGVRDVETALADLQGALIAESRLAAAVDSARQAAAISRLRYREGVDAFFTVLDAERSLSQAEDSLAVARTRAAQAYVRLGQALGAGWSDAVVNEASPN